MASQMDVCPTDLLSDEELLLLLDGDSMDFNDISNTQLLNTNHDEPMENDSQSRSSFTNISRPAPVAQSGGNYPVDTTLEFELLGTTPAERNGRYRRLTRKFEYKVKHNLSHFSSNLFEVEDAVDRAFLVLFSQALSGVDPSNIVSGYLRHTSLTEPIYIKPVRKDKFSPRTILDSISKVAQSNDKFLLEGELILELHATELLRGGLYGKKTYDEGSTNTKRSVITIMNQDTLCLPRALVVGREHADNKGSKTAAVLARLKYIIRGDRPLQKSEALKLCSDAGVDSSKPMDLTHLIKFQQHLRDYVIIVVDANLQSRLYPAIITPHMCGKKPIFVQYKKALDEDIGHFNTITSMGAYLGAPFYCLPCHRGFFHVEDHKCSFVCKMCLGSPPCIGEQSFPCSKCGRSFKNEECFRKHNQNNVCQVLQICPKCKVYLKTRYRHVCGTYQCQTCGELHGVERHYCFVAPKDKEQLLKEDRNLKVFIVFDIESTQKSKPYIKPNERIHEPNLLICHVFCDKCWDTQRNRKAQDPCEFCGKGIHSFVGSTCVKCFVGPFLNEISRKHKDNKIFVFAHNGKGYDFQFIIHELIKAKKGAQAVMNGLKLLKVEVANVRFIDTLSLFAQPLSSLPKAFGLDASLAKGYFPHEFNLDKNLDYRGPLPSPEMYGIKYMKEGTRQKFMEWYNERILNNYFDFREEIVHYCLNDVLVLAQCVMKFRTLFKEVTGLDPITRCFTLASIGMEVFKSTYLQPKTLGSTPLKGYSCFKNTSSIANAWLDYIEITKLKRLTRESKVGAYIVDAYDPIEKTVYEFLGCHWHGCLCQKDRQLVNQTGKSNDVLYRETRVRLEIIKSLGFHVVSVWECELRSRCQNNPRIQDIIRSRVNYHKKMKVIGRLNPRDSFFGGRTNNLKYMHIAEENERIRYVDFTSLYPFVVKNMKYPVGHPKVITHGFKDIGTYFGFVKCKVAAPSNLYLPVLPAKINNRLVFPLCVKCAEDRIQDYCLHQEKQRYIRGTWTTAELSLAVEKGYIIKKIYEVNHWDKSSCTLFSDYMNKWAKVKQEASGWPDASYTENIGKQAEYIQSYEEREKIKLDINKISKNPGLRFIAKLMLNSFWGKLAQRTNMTKTAFLQNYQQYIELALDPNKELLGERMVTEDQLLVNWKYTDDDMDNSASTSITIASFVTSYARVKLYRLLDEIESVRPGRLLYKDTDSAIFVERRGDPPLKNMGNYLGQLTDEIADEYGPNAVCKKFLSAGPKNYAYEVHLPDGTTKTVMKVKGLTLHAAALRTLSLGAMHSIIDHHMKRHHESLLVDQFQICPNGNFQVYTKEFQKKYRVVSTKRISHGNNTYPIGYQ